MRDFPYLQEAIGLAMEELRRERGMTKLMLADFSGLQDSYIRSIAKGRKRPSIIVLYSLAEAFGIEPVDFLARIEKTRKRLIEEAVAKKCGSGWREDKVV